MLQILLLHAYAASLAQTLASLSTPRYFLRNWKNKSVFWDLRFEIGIGFDFWCENGVICVGIYRVGVFWIWGLKFGRGLMRVVGFRGFIYGWETRSAWLGEGRCEPLIRWKWTVRIVVSVVITDCAFFLKKICEMCLCFFWRVWGGANVQWNFSIWVFCKFGWVRRRARPSAPTYSIFWLKL